MDSPITNKTPENDPNNQLIHRHRVVLSGFLYRRSISNKKWKKRWFVLRAGGQLINYRTSDEYEALGMVDLRQVYAVTEASCKRQPHTIAISIDETIKTSSDSAKFLSLSRSGLEDPADRQRDLLSDSLSDSDTQRANLQREGNAVFESSKGIKSPTNGKKDKDKPVNQQYYYYIATASREELVNWIQTLKKVIDTLMGEEKQTVPIFAPPPTPYSARTTNETTDGTIEIPNTIAQEQRLGFAVINKVSQAGNFVENTLLMTPDVIVSSDDEESQSPNHESPVLRPKFGANSQFPPSGMFVEFFSWLMRQKDAAPIPNNRVSATFGSTPATVQRINDVKAPSLNFQHRRSSSVDQSNGYVYHFLAPNTKASTSVEEGPSRSETASPNFNFPVKSYTNPLLNSFSGFQSPVAPPKSSTNESFVSAAETFMELARKEHIFLSGYLYKKKRGVRTFKVTNNSAELLELADWSHISGSSAAGTPKMAHNTTLNSAETAKSFKPLHVNHTVWHVRWCVLRGTTLCWYEDSREYEALRVLDMKDVVEVVSLKSSPIELGKVPGKYFTQKSQARILEFEDHVDHGSPTPTGSPKSPPPSQKFFSFNRRTKSQNSPALEASLNAARRMKREKTFDPTKVDEKHVDLNKKPDRDCSCAWCEYGRRWKTQLNEKYPHVDNTIDLLPPAFASLQIYWACLSWYHDELPTSMEPNLNFFQRELGFPLSLPIHILEGTIQNTSTSHPAQTSSRPMSTIPQSNHDLDTSCSNITFEETKSPIQSHGFHLKPDDVQHSALSVSYPPRAATADYPPKKSTIASPMTHVKQQKGGVYFTPTLPSTTSQQTAQLAATPIQESNISTPIVKPDTPKHYVTSPPPPTSVSMYQTAPTQDHVIHLYPIQLVTVKRSFYFATVSAEECDLWLTHLRQAFVLSRVI